MHPLGGAGSSDSRGRRGSGLWVIVNVSAEVECASNHAPYTWAFKVKQANDFNGTPGNDLAQDAAVVNTVTGTCGIVFAAQPRHAEKAPVAITNAIYNPAGPPVSVSVRSGDGLQTVGWWSGTITLAIGDIPAGASPTLGGTTTGPAINGVVTFAPTINASATGYSLVAAASATAGTPSVGTTTNGLESNSFNIVDDAMICTASAEGCEALAGVGQRTQARVRAIGNGAAGDLVILSLNDPAESIECAGYTESSGGRGVRDPDRLEVSGLLPGRHRPPWPRAPGDLRQPQSGSTVHPVKGPGPGEEPGHRHLLARG